MAPASLLLARFLYGIMTEECVILEIRIDEAAQLCSGTIHNKPTQCLFSQSTATQDNYEKRLWLSGYRNGFAYHKVPSSRLDGHCTLSTELQTDYHHNCIIKLSIRWCVWKVGYGFLNRVYPKILKWVVVYSSVKFHINRYIDR